MATSIIINTAARRLSLLEGEQVINSFPVAVGKPSTPTPTGNFEVLIKQMWPGGVLGSRWIQFTWRKHGIHGTNQPWLIGQAVSHGCVRMYNQDVNVVYGKVEVGTPIRIVGSVSTSHPGNEQQPQQPGQNGGKGRVYIVQRGDSLWSIARRFNLSVSSLMRANNLSTSIIYPGQRLTIPPG
ncbi:MAG: L,D-transpeptidase family protein [Halanaerobium sp.]|nr:L,D-transpeptidase family protein [Halanaerobium sp.]